MFEAECRRPNFRAMLNDLDVSDESPGSARHQSISRSCRSHTMRRAP